MKRTTIRDIARYAGVSVSTVSLVLSNRGYVSEKTRARVNKVIAKHNYYPRQSARNLASGRTGNLGFIISDAHLSGSEFFYSRVLLGAELEARKKDFYLLLTTVGDTFNPQDDVPRFLKGRDVDAVIIAGGVPVDLIRYVQTMDLPLVLIDFKPPALKSNLIMIENFDGAYGAVQHLLQRGSQKVAFVGGSSYHSSIQERFRGYQAALRDAGKGELADDPSVHYLVQEETSIQIGFDGTCDILDRDTSIDAIVCANDTTAIGCLQALKQRKLNIPEDVAVVGFDDIMHALDTDPALTTVHVPKFEIGIQSVRLIFDLLEQPTNGLQTRLINTELVVRASTNGKTSPVDE